MSRKTNWLGIIKVGGKMLLAGIISSVVMAPLNLLETSENIGIKAFFSIVTLIGGLLITGLIDVKLWKFERDKGLWSYVMTGLKHMIAGIIAMIPIIILALVAVGGSILTLLVNPIAGIVTIGIFAIIAIPVMLFIMGFVANKIWKWK